jgi:hypothetical protein
MVLNPLVPPSPRTAQTLLKKLSPMIGALALTTTLSIESAQAAGRAGRGSTKKSSVSSEEAAAVGPSHVPRNTIVFVEAAVRNELGTLKQVESVGTLEEEVITDVKALGPMFTIGFVTKIFGDFRAGGSIGYGMNANLTQRPTAEEKEDPDFEAEQFRFGQLITGDLRIEFSKYLGDKFSLLVTPRGGISIIQVGEDLRDFTETIADSHFVSKPRLGFFLGGDVGTRYQITPYFGMRATFGLGYAYQSYLKATRNGDSADSNYSWSSSTSRMTWGLAGEASF